MVAQALTITMVQLSHIKGRTKPPAAETRAADFSTNLLSEKSCHLWHVFAARVVSCHGKHVDSGGTLDQHVVGTSSSNLTAFNQRRPRGIRLMAGEGKVFSSQLVSEPLIHFFSCSV